MASDKQIQANRLNAQKSTGPQSPEGKKRVAQNRIKHGLAGEHVVLANEDPSAFDDLLATLNENWDPHSETEAFLVETLAFNQWRLLRIGRMEHASLSRKIQSHGQPTLSMEVEDLSRYEGRARRAYYQALNMLIKLQAVREKQQQQQQPLEEEVVVMAAAKTEPAAQHSPPPQQPLLSLSKGAEPAANPTTIAADGHSNPVPPGQAPGPRPPLPDAA